MFIICLLIGCMMIPGTSLPERQGTRTCISVSAGCFRKMAVFMDEQFRTAMEKPQT